MEESQVHAAVEPPTAIAKHLDAAVERHPRLAEIRGAIVDGFAVLDATRRGGGTIYLCGNGGSAADAEHFAAELLKGFEDPRRLPEADRARLSLRLATGLQRGIRAVPLTGFVGARTAIGNDTDAGLEFAQLAWTLVSPGDTLFAISTSGRSANVVLAAEATRARGGRVVALTGGNGGELAATSDVAIRTPARRTLEVQELHLPVYHALALMLEASLNSSDA